MNWNQPKDVSVVEAAFSASNGYARTLAMSHLMPSLESIPPEFRNLNGGTKWHRMQAQWFFRGLDMNSLTPKPGIDLQRALRHLTAIQCSFEPKHEHKVAAVAYLASLWFADWKEPQP